MNWLLLDRPCAWDSDRSDSILLGAHHVDDSGFCVLHLYIIFPCFLQRILEGVAKSYGNVVLEASNAIREVHGVQLKLQIYLTPVCVARKCVICCFGSSAHTTEIKW